VTGVAVHTGNVFADELDGLIELILAASGDEDVCALFDEELGCSERHAGRRCGDDSYLSFELSHYCSPFICARLALELAAASLSGSGPRDLRLAEAAAPH